MTVKFSRPCKLVATGMFFCLAAIILNLVGLLVITDKELLLDLLNLSTILGVSAGGFLFAGLILSARTGEPTHIIFRRDCPCSS